MPADLGLLVRELRAGVDEGAGPDELGEVVSSAVGRWVAHDGLRAVETNPAAGLFLGSLSCWHRYDLELINALVLDRFTGGDPWRPDDLARLSVPVGVVGMGEAADRYGGRDGVRVGRTREILAVHGVGCEMRLLLRDHSGVWGFLGLVRSADGRPFDCDDVDRAIRLGPLLVAAARGYAKAGPLVPEALALPAGVITVGPDHTIRGITPQAQAWLGQLRIPGQGSPSAWIEPFAAELSLHVRENARDSRIGEPVIRASLTNAGRWVAIHGQPLDQGAVGDVAIVIQAASGDLLLSSFCHWHQITARERQVIEQLYTGASAKQIARAMHLSVYTVNDHLRSIYRKTGAAGRDSLIAALTS
jgi:DNA-binding CsgD family transcriptional regulator